MLSTSPLPPARHSQRLRQPPRAAAPAPEPAPSSDMGDSFWRDGGGFPHYLQSRKSGRDEPCDCTQPVGVLEADGADTWGCVRSSESKGVER